MEKKTIRVSHPFIESSYTAIAGLWIRRYFHKFISYLISLHDEIGSKVSQSDRADNGIDASIDKSQQNCHHMVNNCILESRRLGIRQFKKSR